MGCVLYWAAIGFLVVIAVGIFIVCTIEDYKNNHDGMIF